ncbi:replication fork protection component Swi3-domain-containing protein, partial [Mycena pura]
MDVEDIWDIPAAPRSPPRTPNADLFLPGSDDENDRMSDAPPLGLTREAEIDVDALFGDVDNLPNETGQDDRALGLTSRPILSSSPAHRLDGDDKSGGEKDAKKQKKKIARLDEGRLVDDNGFPRLAEDTKAFKIKGKGHEAHLSRLLQVYQFWTHRLYPKTPFKETIDRVEKLCHSKRMHNMLSVWRDQAHGKQSGADGDEDDELLDLS